MLAAALSSNPSYNIAMSEIDFSKLAADIKDWARDLGFQETAITDIDLEEYQSLLKSFIEID